ncbi:MAG: hypothetical protein RI894_2646 [Bacteroidota bacterium]
MGRTIWIRNLQRVSVRILMDKHLKFYEWGDFERLMKVSVRILMDKHLKVTTITLPSTTVQSFSPHFNGQALKVQK